MKNIIPIREQLAEIIGKAFSAAGYDGDYGAVEVSKRRDLAQFQCNDALRAAKAHKSNPRAIAEKVRAEIQPKEIFKDLSIAGPGFLNISLSDDFLTGHLQAISVDERLGCPPADQPMKIIVDYGGANIAKPLHVGHLRAAIIGESLKRLARFLGHEVLGDVHLGDWGLQMGMVISEIERRQPDLPYFKDGVEGPFPAEPPITIEDLEEIYPAVSARAKAEPEVMEAARQATSELQQGHPGYRALWQHIFDVSVADLKSGYGQLDIEFDLWLGESHTQDRIPEMLDKIRRAGKANESEGALVIDVTRPDDNREIPPLMLVKSDGAYLYGTTDLATIDQRVEDYQPDLLLYVVDKRQSDHFIQVFRGAYISGIAPESLVLEHSGFGTMNGKDGKPFKTRAGGVMKLKDLVEMITNKALERMEAAEISAGYDQAEKNDIAVKVGVAALKFADLMNHRTRDYIFDLDRFTAFDGATGPYLLYTAVRSKSILRKAAGKSLLPGALIEPANDIERDIYLKIGELPDVLRLAFDNRAPNYMCDYAFNLASLFNRFIHEHHILNEKDQARQSSWLRLTQLVAMVLEQVCDLLGFTVPERM